jgi:hypothetical protein
LNLNFAPLSPTEDLNPPYEKSLNSSLTVSYSFTLSPNTLNKTKSPPEHLL